jgi:outer membrane protein assembly factor BamA
MASRVAIAALVLCACHGATVHRPGEEWLRPVVLHGNHAFSDDELATGLGLHRARKHGEAFDPYLVKVDAERLRGQYLRAGYFGVEIQPRVERLRDAVTVTFAIVEGPRARTRVVIEGLPATLAREVRARIPLADGTPFDYAVYERAKPALLAAVQDAGYARAKLDAFVTADQATATATIHLGFTPGPVCRFGTVAIQGVGGDLRTAIEARLHFGAGDLYSNHALAATRRELYAMNRFSAVQVRPEPGTAPTVDVVIAVASGSAHQVSLGGGFGIDPVGYEIRARTGYEIAGWPTPLDTLTTELRPAYAYLRDGTGTEPRIRALARLDRLDLFLTRAVGSVEAGYRYLAYEAFTEYGPEAQLAYTLPIGWRLHLRAAWRLERYDFRALSPLLDPALSARLGLDQPEQLGAFDQSLIADFRDHPLEPKLGWYGELRVTEGTRFAGGAYTYQELVPELRGYVPIGRVVLAARARYGAIRGDVPPTERFYAGGAASQRGFPERRLSPFRTGPVMGSTLVIPYGGAGMIDTSVEARVPLATVHDLPIGGVAFLDGGDVTEQVGDLALGNLAWAAGVGLRVHTLVGPIRADLGVRLNRTAPTDPDPGSRYAFHLSLGEAF